MASQLLYEFINTEASGRHIQAASRPLVGESALSQTIRFKRTYSRRRCCHGVKASNGTRPATVPFASHPKMRCIQYNACHSQCTLPGQSDRPGFRWPCVRVARMTPAASHHPCARYAKIGLPRLIHRTSRAAKYCTFSGHDSIL